MNLTLYAVTAFIILDTDGNRVLSKYYRQETNPSSSKGLANTKEQRAFEKGLWQKTKKSGGSPIALSPFHARSIALSDIRPLRVHFLNPFPFTALCSGCPLLLDHT